MIEFNQKLKDEIARFRQVGHQFLKKEITTAEFKGASGGMGVYAQRGGEKFMLRLRIPSGVLSLSHLKLITEFAKQYKLDTIHLTTRQAVQLHDLGIDEVCDIMEAAIDHGLYSRGSGGNFPRNVALSPLSGVESGEAFDVTPYALQVGNYLLERITEYRLPRKLKISFSNSDRDSANSTINDTGFLAVTCNKKPYFKLYLAGGLGPNPSIALNYDELIPPEEILYYVEAVIRLFMEEGDYQNKGRARLRYIPGRMGRDAFMECYKKHLAKVKEELVFEGIKPVLAEEMKENGNVDLNPQEYFKENKSIENNITENDCLIPQKQKGLYTVLIHPLCGLMPADTLTKILAFFNDCDNPDMRLGMSESMYIRNLSADKAEELLALTKEVRQVSRIQRSVSCVGVPTCQIGVEQSQELCKSILKRLDEKRITGDYLPSVHISGCGNSCARHQVNEIGFAGGKKRVGEAVEDVFELHVGGQHGRDNTKFGRAAGIMKKDDIPEFMAELAEELKRNKMYFKDFLVKHSRKFDEIAGKFLV